MTDPAPQPTRACPPHAWEPSADAHGIYVRCVNCGHKEQVTTHAAQTLSTIAYVLPRRMSRVVGSRVVVIVAVAILVAAVAVAFFATRGDAASRCIVGSGAYTTAAIGCTPGAYVGLTASQVCTPKDRPSLSSADRREVLRRYGLATWTGANGELDHRVPFFLGGKTTPANIWPERGSIPNPKDELEDYVRRRICGGSSGYHPDRSTMGVRFGRRIFLTDWRVWFCRYGLYAPDPKPRVCTAVRF